MQTNKIIFIDISTLFESYYTGIPNVNFQIVKYFFNKNNCYYFHMNNIIKKNVIADIIEKKRGGEWLLELNNSGKMYEQTIDEVIEQNNYSKTVGIFSHVKRHINKFDQDIQIIYDLTFLLTPELHMLENIELHSKTFEEEINSNYLNVCISESTKEDLITYFEIPPEKCVVNYLASMVEYDEVSFQVNTTILKEYNLDKYILILGTLEPRKNIQIVFEFLEKNPKFLNDYKVVFLGKDGWGKSFKEKIELLDIDIKFKQEKIIHMGYVEDQQRNSLVQHASSLIYPSVYEGFGLPVLESLSLGTPVVTTFSSSIPEIALDLVSYFDPYSLDSFSKALYKTLNNEIDKKTLIEYAQQYSWGNFGNQLEMNITIK